MFLDNVSRSSRTPALAQEVSPPSFYDHVVGIRSSTRSVLPVTIAVLVSRGFELGAAQPGISVQEAAAEFPSLQGRG